MSKKKYVDYGKLLEERHRLGLDEMSRISKVNAFNHFIDTLPLADVEEVRHGKWSCCRDEMGYKVYKCSECNAETGIDNAEDADYLKRCPFCEAKMDKE